MADRQHLDQAGYDEYVWAHNPMTLAELENMPRAELIRRYDVLARGGAMTPEDFRDELNRRAVKAATDASNRLAWVVVGLTVLQVVLVVYEITSRAP